MSRPCKSRHPVAADHAAVCRLCELATTDGRYAALWGEPPPTATSSVARPPGKSFGLPVCPLRGEPTGETRPCPTCTGTVRVPLLACSVHGTCTDSKLIAGVKCCRICDDRPVVIRDPWKQLVTVPPIPPLEVTPTKSRVVVTCAAGRAGADLLAISGPGLRRYAERCGADFLVLDWPGVPGWGVSAKFMFRRAVDAWDRAAFLDADVLLDDLVPDLFDLVPRTHVGGHDDLPCVLKNARSNSTIPEEYQRVLETQGVPRRPLRTYLNTGVLVASREHSQLFDPPPRPIPPLHCAEQHWWSHRIVSSGTPVYELPSRLNHQWWVEQSMAGAGPGFVRHYAGMHDRSRRLAEMRLAAIAGSPRPTPAG